MHKTRLRSPFRLLLTASIAVACARHERPDARPAAQPLATPTATPTPAKTDTGPTENATSISASAPSQFLRPGDPHKAGIPVPPGGDLAKAKHRYLLKDARWDAVP